jgi:hypothetical protein
MTALVSRFVIVPEFDPLDVDPALRVAMDRAPAEQRELALLEDPDLGALLEWALLCEIREVMP